MTILERLERTGIRRLGRPKAFRYATGAGARASGVTLKRIESLKIPPAWKQVRIHPSARASVQAIGKDAAGRWQYLYHPGHVARREKRKYERVLLFATALPKMRRAVRRDLARHGLVRERVLACILRILSTCFMRPGSQVYAAENGSYGIATLRRHHVSVRGDVVHFDFPGKSGKRQQRELQDRQVARLVRQLRKVGGPEVFKFIDDNGAIVDIRRRHINEYIKELMGERFSAKDFRTWAGTLICACALARGLVESGSKSARKRAVAAAIRETAAHLGNTPAVCRSSYIYPSVLTSYERGRVVTRYFAAVEELVSHRGNGLHASERALLTLLKRRAA
jgi:DNA topoisomerase-1